MPENQNVEYKASWRDEYLKWVCGFANAQGGKIFIGMDDKGKVIGVEDYKKLMDDIPNKTVSHLGVVVDVNLHRKSGRYYLELNVPASKVPVSYHGTYHYRSGSTKQELKGIALQNWLLKKMGMSWEDIPIPSATIEDLDGDTITAFIETSIKINRLPANAARGGVSTLLRNLELMTKEGELTNAALLVFGKKPSAVSVTMSFRIGKFGTEPYDLVFQDIIETNLFNMPDKVMEKLNDRYLVRPISYKGLKRIEALEYPEQALREAILNAIIHKDYSSTWIFLRVHDDSMEIWNPGILPEELTIDQLKVEHSSFPRNKHIAGVFFRSGYIESWGRGTNKIIDSCIEAGLPEPIMKEEQGGVSVTFLKEIYTEKYLQNLDIHERQIKAILYIKEHGEISNTKYQELNNVGKTIATRDLQDLANRNLVKQIGKAGRGTKYILINRIGR